MTAGLNFVTNAALRDRIRLDISAATSAYQNAEWKAATVLAGAAAEALLLCVFRRAILTTPTEWIEDNLPFIRRGSDYPLQ